MPAAETYESWLLGPLSSARVSFEPVWVRLHTRSYSTCDLKHIESSYQFFDKATTTRKLDGLIVTGAAVDREQYRQVRYMAELTYLLQATAARDVPILGICWGALAVGHALLNLPKRNYETKLLGVFKTRALEVPGNHFVQPGETFWCPHARNSGFDKRPLERMIKANKVRVVAESDESGPVILESTEPRALMHRGHPEYKAKRLVEEYQRDRKSKELSVEKPLNLDLNRPVNRWRGHCRSFFGAWLRFIKETRSR